MERFFDQLMSETAKARDEFSNHPKILSVQSIGMTAEKYQKFLVQLYHVVLNFCPILSIAADRLEKDQKELRENLLREIEDERGHEAWIMQDYIAVGGGPDDLLMSKPALPIEALIGSNYSVAYRTPVGVFGMRFAQELIARDFAGDALESIGAAMGRVPNEANGFQFLKSQSQIEALHVQNLAQLFDYPISHAGKEAIVRCAQINFHLFTQLIENE